MKKQGILAVSKTSKYDSYVDKNGYNIVKKSLKPEEISNIKKDLHVQPYLQGDPDVPFIDVYTETDKIITIPRFYGIENFGNPKKYMLDHRNSGYKFLGQLRDIQKNIMDKTIPHLEKNYGGILSVPCASGKCLARDTKIIMFDGSIKNVQDIIVGDKIMGDDSTMRNILSITKGNEEMFNISNHLLDVDYTVNKSHILSLKCKNNVRINGNNYSNGNIIDISVEEYIQLDDNIKGSLSGYRVPIDFPRRDVPIDPYYYGLNLNKINGMQNLYIHNSDDIRRGLLAGILDKYAICDKYKKCYSLVNKDNMDCGKFIYLARSLGYTTHMYDYDGTIYIDVHGDLAKLPVKLLNDHFVQNISGDLTYDFNIKSIGNGDYYGFEIDGNRRFVLGDFSVTHNTVMALYLGNYFKAKTLVLVHKSFLLNQWIERAKQFTDAKIGILQRNNIPDPDCDIVVGMIQSICFKNYDKKVFEGFKLLVIDECILGDQYILTDRGGITIQKLYEKWKASPNDVPMVLSYNGTTNIFEYKNITYAWEKYVIKKCVDIIYGENTITCTSDHMFLTSDGSYKKAIELTKNNYVVSNCLGNVKKYSSDQIQILLAHILMNVDSFRIIDDCVIYENTGKCYDPEVTWFVKNMDCNVLSVTNGNVTYSTGMIYIKGLVRNHCFDVDYVVNNVDILAIKYSIYAYGWIGAEIDSMSFKKKITNLLDEYMIGYVMDNNVIRSTSTEKFVHIPLEINRSTNGYIKIDKILVHNTKSITVYDLEVKDNHNFVITGKRNTSYGLVAHNCHHYASPVFSKGVQKCGSPYILALSATPYRKDRLTNILMWNFGKIFYRQKTKTNKQVICKIFRFKSKDKLFVEKKQWFKGQMKASHTKMVNNLVLIKNRNIQLVNILNELRKYPERKVLVLSGRKEHLKTLKEAVDESITEDIGKGILEPMEYRTYYYMGNMKNSYRKEAEDYGDMLFGTYEMAHEGLDIDRLNTIVMVTPKKDIVQSVGRVMRRILKVGDLRPLIIDIRDELSIYKKQGDVRIKQYNNGKYKIENYYLEDDKILNLEDHLKKEFGMTTAHINEYLNEHREEIYVPTWKSILDMQKVEGEDEDKEIETYEVDPNEIDISDDDLDSEGDDEGEDDEDDEDSGVAAVYNKNEKINLDGKEEEGKKVTTKKRIATKAKYKPISYSGYMF